LIGHKHQISVSGREMNRTEKRERSNILEAKVGQRPACEVSKLELVSSGLVGYGDSGWVSLRGSG